MAFIVGLNLHGDLALEWDEYVKCLILLGITLTDASDRLVWIFKKQSRNVSSKLAYNSLVQKHSACMDCWWVSHLWSSNLPLKIKCFN